MNKFKYISGAGNSFYIGDELNINSDLEVIAYVADSIHEIDGVISLTIDNDNNNPRQTLQFFYYALYEVHQVDVLRPNIYFYLEKHLIL